MLDQIFSFLKHVFPTLLLLAAATIILIIVVRFIFHFLLNKAYKSLKKVAKEKFKYSNKKRFDKEDEELMRVLESLPKAHSAEKEERRRKGLSNDSYELIVSDEQEQEKKELAEVKVVDIVKPMGFWTSMILGQKLTYLVSAAQIINQRSQRGFWVSMIEAKERAAGKERGRGL